MTDRLKIDGAEIKRILASRPELGTRPDAPVRLEPNGTLAARNGGIETRWMDVTPELARGWLRNNLVNRNLSEATVVGYAREMKAGNFVATHQGIAFNDAEELIDGQHKLTAIVLSGVTVRFMVTFGLPKQITGKNFTVMDVIDRGRPRSVGDQLRIQHGLKDASVIAGICQGLANLCCEDRMRRMSVGQALEVLAEFRAEVDWVVASRSRKAGLRQAGVLAAFALAHKALGCGVVEPLFAALNDLTRAGESGLDKLRAFLTGGEAVLFTPRLNHGLAELTLEVIHAEVAGRRLERLEPGTAGAGYCRARLPESLARVRRIFQVGELAAFTAPRERKGRGEARPKVAVERPSLERLLAAVEQRCGMARMILTGRGQDEEIHQARSVFAVLARAAGHADEEIAGALRRPVEWLRYVPAEGRLRAAGRKALKAVRKGLGL